MSATARLRGAPDARDHRGRGHRLPGEVAVEAVENFAEDSLCIVVDFNENFLTDNKRECGSEIISAEAR